MAGVYGGPANLVDMVGGTAEKPYVCRLLLPAIVRVSATAAERAGSALGAERGARAVERLGSFVLRHTHAPPHAFEHASVYGVYALQAFLCFIGLALLLRAMLRRFYPSYPPWVVDFAPIAALVILPVLFFRYVSFVYDPMTLVVFAFGLYLIARRLLPAYLIFFPLAVLSKETAILLLPVVLVRGMGRGSRVETVAVILYHVVVFVGVKALLASAFHGSGGGFLKLQGSVNLELLTNPGTWGAIAAKTIIPALPLAFLVLHRWGTKPAFLRRALQVMGIPLLIGCSLFGSIGELRTYYEIYPVVVLLAVPSMAHAFGWDTFGTAAGSGSKDGQPEPARP